MTIDTYMILVRSCVRLMEQLFVVLFPAPGIVNPEQLTSGNLDIYVIVLRSIGTLLVRIIPGLDYMDEETLQMLLTPLTRLLACLIYMYMNNDSSINQGNLNQGDIEALEVYQDLNIARSQDLREIITAIRRLLGL